jgi:hypothetical protein
LSAKNVRSKLILQKRIQELILPKAETIFVATCNVISAIGEHGSMPKIGHFKLQQK